MILYQSCPFGFASQVRIFIFSSHWYITSRPWYDVSMHALVYAVTFYVKVNGTLYQRCWNIEWRYFPFRWSLHLCFALDISTHISSILSTFTSYSDYLISLLTYFFITSLLPVDMKDLVEVVMPITYQHLMAIKALNDEFLNHIFVGLFFSLMPKHHAFRILDSFLIEGGKILYRYVQS